MSDSPPKVVRLLKELRQVARWRMLGLNLEIPPEAMSWRILKIRQQFLSDGVEERKAAMFDLWLRSNPNASWDIVASALEQAGEAVLASEIRKKMSALYGLRFTSADGSNGRQRLFAIPRGTLDTEFEERYCQEVH